MDFSVFANQSPAHNDFRSDTFTTPTPSMIQSLALTTLGDAVYNEDLKTIELEKKLPVGQVKRLGCIVLVELYQTKLPLELIFFNLHTVYFVIIDHISMYMKLVV